MARVDLIVPTYNGTSYLIACLKSLGQSTFTDFRLIVVDDGSNEPVDSEVTALFDDATVLRNDTNVGLTSVFNQAIHGSENELVVLLNNDTEVEATWLANLVGCADRHPEAGSIASKLRLHSDRRVIHSAGDTYSVRGMPGNRGVWLEDFGQYDREGPLFAACAGAALYRRSALDRVRLPNGDIFDTRLFMYCEDVDLAWRLQIQGYPCVFAPDAVVYHHLSATGGGKLASYFVARNIWLVLSNSVPGWYLRKYRLRIFAYQAGRLIRAVRALRNGGSRTEVTGTFAGMFRFALSRENNAGCDDTNRERIEALLLDR